MSPRIQGHGSNVPPTEGAILSKIETSLEYALQDLGLEASTSPVKRQKYLYLAINEFTDNGQNPITYSWFKWGASAIAGPGGPDTGQTFLTDRAKADPLLTTQLSDYKEFFINGDHNLRLTDWWEADFLDFLEQFYTHSAPDKYKELYLNNIKLLKIIDDIEAAIFLGRDPARKETYSDICDISADLKGEILIHDELENEYEITAEFTSLLEDVVMSLVDISEDDLTKGHQTATSELRNHYRDHVWVILAHNLSLETAVGPNKNNIYQNSQNKLSELRNTFGTEYKTKKRICGSVDLVPGLEDYQTEPAEFTEKGEKFLRIVEGRQDAQ